MTLLSAYSSALDPFAIWQKVNGAAYCVRLAATITVAHCEQNRQKTNHDFRCYGCGGLNSQEPVKAERPAQSLLHFDEIIAVADRSTPTIDNLPTSITTLDNIIDHLYDNPSTDDNFEDVEVELDDEQLLALFPELALSEAEDNEINYPRFTEHQTEMPRYPVYKGHCKKCGGYMENTRERKDDHVFRCLACGWRTSPEYERNRAIQVAGGIL